MSLSADQFGKLKRDGYVVVPNVVSPALRDKAVRAINQRLGQGISTSEADQFVNGLCFPELMSRPVITDLFNRSAAAAAVRSAVGPIHPVLGGQIACAAFSMPHVHYMAR